MRRIAWMIMIVCTMGCSSDDLSWISIHNDTRVPLYALPYSSDFSDGSWIQPGFKDEFYSINCDCLDGYEYFSFYYDSLIIHIKGQDEHSIKFYKDGTAVNYDPTLNPFTNPDVWKAHEFHQELPGTGFETATEKNILEHYFSIETEHVKSMADTVYFELNPAF
jgi:hypothetical protein